MTNKHTLPAGNEPRVLFDVLPDLSTAAVDVGRLYWVGALPHAPQFAIDCAGIHFPKESQTLRRRNTMGTVDRTTHLGVVVRITENQLEKLAERLRYKIVRPLPRNGASSERGAGQVLDKDELAPIVGTVLSVPTPEEAQQLVAKGYGSRLERMKARPGDRPLAEFLWLVPLKPGEKARQRPIDSQLPPSIAETGIAIGDGDPVPVDVRVGAGDGYDQIAARLAPKTKSILAELDRLDAEGNRS